MKSILEIETEQLCAFIKRASNLWALTGAGISTGSNIPDYRGVNGSYSKGHKPLVHQDFVQKESSRKRYWARSLIGFQSFSRARPNPAHLSLAKLERHGILKGVITQNVDRLHSKAGSINCIDLHGRNDMVMCMACRLQLDRQRIHQQLEAHNAEFMEQQRFLLHRSATGFPGREIEVTLQDILRADGDAEVVGDEQAMARFKLVDCPECGGILKPTVVFFGDNVDPKTRAEADAAAQSADAVLVVGTSLEVFSAYRFIDAAAKANVPVALVNQGQTRAERNNLQNIAFKSNTDCAVLLSNVVDSLLCR